jgi:GNAT superfamily N-acetyltransferase
MFVLPRARGKGISKLLLFALLSFAKEHGYKEVMLTTTTAQRAAIGLYTSHGFVEGPARRAIDWLRSIVECDFRKTLE